MCKKKYIQTNCSLQEQTLVDVAEQSLQKLTAASSSGSRPMCWQFACMDIVCCIHGLRLHACARYLLILLHAQLLMQFLACMVFACCMHFLDKPEATHSWKHSCTCHAWQGSFIIACMVTGLGQKLQKLNYQRGGTDRTNSSWKCCRPVVLLQRPNSRPRAHWKWPGQNQSLWPKNLLQQPWHLQKQRK